MQLNESYELVSKKSLPFPKNYARNSEETDDSFGGIIKKGQLGWRANGQYFEVYSMKTGHKITQFSFETTLGLEDCIITCICEIQVQSGCLLAIGVQYGDSPGGLIAIFSLKNCQILRCIEVQEKVISCHYIPPEIAKRTVLNIMSGCIAIGTDSGSILLVDLNLVCCEEVAQELSNSSDVQLIRSHVYEGDLDMGEIEQNMHLAHEDDLNFVIKLQSVERGGFVLCLQSVTPLLSLFAGLEDGRLVMYDLTNLRLLDVIEPVIRMSPLVKLSYLEPPDDPQPCIYIWAFHENPQNSLAVMHSLMFQRRLLEDDGVTTYKNFESFNTCLTLPLFQPGSIPISCQSVTKVAPNGEEEAISLCMLAWKRLDRVEIFIFDINQWYKEQMPPEGDWRTGLSYLATFHLNYANPLDIHLDVNSLALFNSIQRCEEHFYPNSLSFDCILLQSNGSYVVTWAGLQNSAISSLSSKGALAILEPNELFCDILEASLLPQFCEHNKRATFSLKAKREVLLSVALEYNCVGLLKDCAKSWSDGSYMGQNMVDALTLSTLTDWAWNRAENIKHQCNAICRPLFDLSGCGLDERSTRQLIYLSRQLKLLSDILEFILDQCNRNIPANVQDGIKNQQKSIKMASEYQEVLLWFVNIGLLPEQRENVTLIPYGFLKNYYDCQRKHFGKVNPSFLNARTKSCKVLFIDSFIDHELNAKTLRDHWIESGGDGLYPPPSLQVILRVFLVPDVTFEKKCSLFLYFFLDLNSAIENEAYSGIVQNFIKFPAVFNLSASLIKTIQAFWNLDHGQFKVAVDEVISPFFGTSNLQQYQLELLIESLLAQSETKLALRTLQIKKIQISTILELKVYLANDMIAEAFHYSRSKSDIELMKIFVKACICLNKFQVLRDLALTDEEGEIVIETLKERKSSIPADVKITYFIHKGKYIEALDHLQEMNSYDSYSDSDIEKTSIILSLYNKGISPVCREINDSYYRLKNGFSDKEQCLEHPYPLSSQLKLGNISKQRGGVYRSSALGIHYASFYWEKQNDKNLLQHAVNAPFVRHTNFSEIFGNTFRTNSVSYPEPYMPASKRRMDNDFNFDIGKSRKDELENPQKRRKIRQDDSNSNVFTTFSMSSINPNLLTKFKTTPSLNSSLLQKRSTFTEKEETKIQSQNEFNLDTPIIRTIEEMESETSSRPGSALQGILKISEKLGSRQSLRTEQDDEEKALRFDLPNMSMNESMVSGKATPIPKDINLSVMSSLTTDSTVFYSPLSSRDTTKYAEEQELEPEPESRSNIKNLTDDAKVFSPLRRPGSLLGKVKGRPPIRSSSESIVTIEDDNDRDVSMEDMNVSMKSIPEEKEIVFMEEQEGEEIVPIAPPSEENITVTIEEQEVEDKTPSHEKTVEEQEVEENVSSYEKNITVTIEEQEAEEDVPRHKNNVTIVVEEQEVDETAPNVVKNTTVTFENKEDEEVANIISPSATFEFKEPQNLIAPVSVNKINTTTFAPFVSSSKFGDLEKFDSAKPLSDKSTIVGSSTMFFQETFSTSIVSRSTAKTTYFTALETQQNLDTTVGMTGFECTQLGIPRVDFDEAQDEDSNDIEEVKVVEDDDNEDSDNEDDYNEEYEYENKEKCSSPDVVCLDSSSGSAKFEVYDENEKDDEENSVESISDSSSENIFEDESCSNEVGSTVESPEYAAKIEATSTTLQSFANIGQANVELSQSFVELSQEASSMASSDVIVEETQTEDSIPVVKESGFLSSQESSQETKTTSECDLEDSSGKTFLTQQMAESRIDDQQVDSSNTESKIIESSKTESGMVTGDDEDIDLKVSDDEVDPSPATQTERFLRANSISKDTVGSPVAKRLLRGSSLPKTIPPPEPTTPSRIRTRRQSQLGVIDEDSPLPSSAQRTRKRLDSQNDSDSGATSTVEKRRRSTSEAPGTPRRSSQSEEAPRTTRGKSVDAESTSTPRRSTRRSIARESVEKEENPTPVRNTRRSVARSPEREERSTPVRNLRRSVARDTPDREQAATPVKNLRRSMARDSPERESEATPVKNLRRSKARDTPERESAGTPIRNLRRSVARDSPDRESAATPVKNVRRSSTARDTPERTTRRRSVAPESPKEQTSSAHNTRGSSQVKELPSKNTRARTKSTDTPPKADEPLTSRRMTRTQKAKATEIEEKVKKASKKVSHSVQHEMDVVEEELSDADSTSSKVSLRSNASTSRKSTRKTKKDDSNDDAVSVSSSQSGVSTRKRRGAKSVLESPEKMVAIPEEENSDNESGKSTSTVGSKKRTRTLRSKK